MPDTFHVGLTRDFLKADGSFTFGDIGLDLLDAAPNLTWDFLPPPRVPGEVQPEEIAGYDAVLVLGPRITKHTLDGAERLLILARMGVGYDSVDVPACTRTGVLLTITPDGVRRPVATSVLAYILALSLRMFDKDRITRAGRSADKLDFMGTGLVGRTLGIIGLGNIGREIVRLTRPLGLRYLTFDPYLTAEDAARDDVELTDLDTLLRTSDIVSVNCALTPETHHLLNAERLALMRPTAYLINTARGPIVDQLALTAALTTHRLAGAALDVFDPEPPDPADPILKLDNVIVAPHAICWTDQCFQAMGQSACRSIVDVAQGRIPSFVVDRDALAHPRLSHLVSA